MIKIIKRSMVFFAMLSLMVPMAGGALAVEAETYILPGVHISEMDVDTPVTTRSLSIPTDFWDLSEFNYLPDLQIVSTSWLYSNYYFRPNSSGEIHWKFYIDPSTYQHIRIGVLDIAANQIYYYEYELPGGTSIAFESYFYGLDTSKNYAVCLKSVYELAHYSFSGDGIISHSPITA